MIRFILSLLCVALFAGCTKPVTRESLVAQHVDRIKATLGANLVTEVSAPVGPFHLTKVTHIYFKAYVVKTRRTYYVDAYLSAWSLAVQDPVYRYSYYQQMPFGLYLPIMR